jgi:hypothetical protein
VQRSSFAKAWTTTRTREWTDEVVTGYVRAAAANLASDEVDVGEISVSM